MKATQTKPDHPSFLFNITGDPAWVLSPAGARQAEGSAGCAQGSLHHVRVHTAILLCQVSSWLSHCADIIPWQTMGLILPPLPAGHRVSPWIQRAQMPAWDNVLCSQPSPKARLTAQPWLHELSLAGHLHTARGKKVVEWEERSFCNKKPPLF